MASDRDVLSALIRIGQLTRQEREAFEGMWDQVDGRRGKLSPRQRAWAEKVYYAQKLDQPMAVKAIDQAGVPWTAFKYSENGGQFQVIREQAGTFADSIKLWSEA